MLSSQTSKNTYTGNGAVDTYAYSFKIFDDDDLLVTVRDTAGVETTLTKTTHYTVTGVDETAGGNVALVNGAFDWVDGDGDLKTSYVLTIRRKLTLTQDLDLRNQGAYLPEDVEDRFDKNIMIAQQHQDEIDRSVKLPESISAATFDPVLPSDLTLNGAGAVPIVNDAGTGWADADEWPSATEISSAQSYATAADASADAAAASETLAEEWATKIDGQVATTDYSAKAWAIGGTGVTDTASRGAAKEWATETASTVDGTEFSAKEYAQGTQAGTGGSAKDWAQETATDVDGAGYSAKEWALGTQTRGVASSGSAKDWANYTAGTVDDTEYSAKKYAVDAAASAASAAATLASAFFRDVVFFTSASSPVTIDQTYNGKLLVFDSSGGAIAVALPTIAGISLPFNIVALSSVAGNDVTFTRGGTDTFMGGGTTKVLSVANTGFQLAADTDTAPDTWSVLEFGSVGDGTISAVKTEATAVQDLMNIGLATSVGSSALTVSLKDAAGSDPSSASPVKIPFRDSTMTSGNRLVRSVTGSLSVVVSSGSTLGHASAVEHAIYVYAIDNAGTVELAVSSVLFDEGKRWSTTAEGGAGAADSNRVLYSTTARTNVPIRLIGRLMSTQATAGTWSTAMAEVALPPFDKQKICARYTGGTQTVAAASPTILNASTKTYDSHNAVTTGASWQFTAPKAGYYRVAATVQFVSRVYAVSNVSIIQLSKNGSFYSQGSADDAATTTSIIIAVNHVDTIYLAAGDYIDIRAYNEGSGGTDTDGFQIAIEEL